MITKSSGPDLVRNTQATDSGIPTSSQDAHEFSSRKITAGVLQAKSNLHKIGVRDGAIGYQSKYHAGTPGLYRLL